MIITGILDLVYGFIFLITSPIRLLPDVALDSNFGSSLTTAGGYLHPLNIILPVDTMLQILLISLGIELAYLMFKVIMWVIAKIPTLN